MSEYNHEIEGRWSSGLSVAANSRSLPVKNIMSLLEAQTAHARRLVDALAAAQRERDEAKHELAEYLHPEFGVYPQVVYERDEWMRESLDRANEASQVAGERDAALQRAQAAEQWAEVLSAEVAERKQAQQELQARIEALEEVLKGMHTIERGVHYVGGYSYRRKCPVCQALAPARPIITDRMQGVDCPECEQSEPHTHVAPARPAVPETWVRLGDLREGAVFQTRDGIRAVKSEYKYSDERHAQSLCILLASGEYAHFPERDDTLVREVRPHLDTERPAGEG